MKKLTSLILIISLFFSLESYPEKKSKDKNQFTINKGTNLAHWLSQSSRRGEARKNFITADDIKAISMMGFDHIRLPVDEEQMWDEQLVRHPEAFQIMENCIKWCSRNNLKVVVDLHILRSHHFNAKEKPLWTNPSEQEKFYKLWLDLSAVLKKYPNSQVAYELMNEAVADDPEQWNQVIAKALKTIREVEPYRTVVIGSNRWQSYSTFDALKVPANDKHILLSFHFYEPFLLTHCHASWNYLRDFNGPVHYPGVILTQDEFDRLPENVQSAVKGWVGREFSKMVIQEMFNKPVWKAKSLGLPLYCGEYGVISDAPDEDMLRWYTDMMQLFEENGISSANWNYKSGNFGLVNESGSPNKKLVEVIKF